MNVQKADNTTVLSLLPNLYIFLLSFHHFLVLSLRDRKKLTMAEGTRMSRMGTTTKENADAIHELKVGQIELQGQIAALTDMVNELLTNGETNARVTLEREGSRQEEHFEN